MYFIINFHFRQRLYRDGKLVSVRSTRTFINGAHQLEVGRVDILRWMEGQTKFIIKTQPGWGGRIQVTW